MAVSSVAPSSAANNYVFSGITNPDAVGTYYLKITIYSSTDASGSYDEYGGLALAVNYAVGVNTAVPPYLYFCAAITIPNNSCNDASGDYADMGDFSSKTTSSASSQLYVATNSETGYSVTVEGLTLTSGNNYIPS